MLKLPEPIQTEIVDLLVQDNSHTVYPGQKEDIYSEK